MGASLAGATLINGPTPALIASISQGGTGFFQYRFQFSGAGTSTFSATASNLSVTSGVITSSLSVTVQSAPALAVQSVSLQPAAVSLGQTFTLLIQVSNTGQATAVGVAPFSLIKLGSASAVPVGPTPTSATLTQGASTFFTYTGQATAAGALSSLGFQASAQGYDANFGTTVTSSSLASNMIVVDTPANLAVAVDAEPALSNIGQIVTLNLTVTNTGQAAALNVLPSAVGQVGTAGFSLLLPASQAAVPSLAPGASHTFSWTYSAAGTGTLSFQVTASGTDQNSQQAVNSALGVSNLLTVQVPVSLTVQSFTALPSSVGTGAPVTVVMTVLNTGTSTALNVSPTNLTTNGTNATIITGMTPASVASLAGGFSQAFTFTVDFGVAQPLLSFTAQAYGVDAVQGIGVTSVAGTSNSVSVFAQGNLQVLSVALSPATQMSIGQILTVVATVSNVGTGGANTVTTQSLVFGTAPLTLLSSPAPSFVSLAAGSATAYTYTYSASGSGFANVSVTASGYDTFGVTRTANAVSAGSAVAVQAATQLSTQITLVPATVSVGQPVTAIVTLSNTGQATANGVTLTVAPVPSSGALTAVLSGMTYTATLAAGQSTVFTFSYSAAAPGAVTVLGTALGYDANSNVTITSSPATSSSTLVQAPALLTSVFNVSPSSSLQGGTFTGILTVSNAAGGANASGVSAPPTVTVLPAGTVTQLSLNPGTPQFVSAGTSVAFTYTFGATLITPTVSLTADVLGQDFNSGVVKNTTVTSNVFNVVDTNPILTSSFWSAVSPSVVTVNQVVTATLEVVNSNSLVTAQNVSATSVGASLAGAVLLSGPTPALIASISQGGTGFFQYRFQFNSAGTSTFSASASALSATPAVISSSLSVTVQTGPSLSLVSSSLQPAAVSLGQTFTLVILVSNTGQATAVGVAPFSLIKLGSASAVPVGPTPTSATLVQGDSVSFTYTGQATAAGALNNLGFQASAQGYDANFGTTVTAASSLASNMIVVDTPANLAVAVDAEPVVSNIGQVVTLNMTVTKTGQATALGVLPSASGQIGTAGFSLGGPASQSPVTLAPGASQHFAWTDTAGGTGTLNFQATASGTDQNSQLVVNSALASSNVLTVQVPVSLALQSFTAAPSSVGTGAPVTVVMTVLNTGTSTALNVSPTNLVTNGTNESVITGMTPASVASLAGGVSQAFTFTVDFSATQPLLSFTAQAYGVDAVQGIGVTSVAGTSNSVSVFAQGNLQVLSVALSPATQMSIGQILTVVATVSNVGTGDANTVTTQALTFGGAALSLLSSPSPSFVSLAAGSTWAYTYTYTASGSGVANVSVTASGYDAFGVTRTANAVSAASGVTVQGATQLSTQITLVPATASVGETVTAFVTLSNTGQATANGVTLLAAPVASSGALTYVPSGMSFTATLAAGQSTVFTFSFSAAAPGSVNVVGTALGYDANSNLTITSSLATSSNTLVQSPALLTSVFNVSPSSSLQGGNFTGNLTVTNAAGGAGASSVSAPPTVDVSPAGTVTQLGSVQPATPQFISAGTSVSFTYTLERVGSLCAVGVPDGRRAGLRFQLRRRQKQHSDLECVQRGEYRPDPHQQLLVASVTECGHCGPGGDCNLGGGQQQHPAGCPECDSHLGGRQPGRGDADQRAGAVHHQQHFAGRHGLLPIPLPCSRVREHRPSARRRPVCRRRPG